MEVGVEIGDGIIFVIINQQRYLRSKLLDLSISSIYGFTNKRAK